MKIFKWIMGFLFAFSITVGLISLFAYFDTLNKFLDHHLQYYYFCHLFIQTIFFSMFTFLACYFVPMEKRFAGFLAIVVSLLFIAIGLYVGFTDKKDFPGDVITIRFLINYVGIAFGLLAGFYLAYKKFKNKNWIVSEDQKDTPQ